MRSSRILLTGASGFVGGRLGPALLEAFPGTQLLAVGGQNIPTIEGAINTASLLGSVDEAERLGAFRPDIVLHLGSRSSVAASSADPYDTMIANLGASLRLGETIRKHAPDCVFVFASSAEVYGSSFLSGPVAETAALAPANTYARSKAAAEFALTDILGKSMRTVFLRLFNHTGPGQDERFAVPTFAAQVARIEAQVTPGSIQVGNLSAVRDFLHVDDVIQAYLKIVSKADALPTGASTFNVCSSVGRSIQSVVDGFIALARAPIAYEIDPARLRPSDIPVAVGVGDKFRATFDWTPAISFDKTLQDVLDYWRMQVAAAAR